MDKIVLDLYTDYLISSFGLTTATGLADLLGGTLSHDRISRFLSKSDFTSAHLWQHVKPFVRKVQHETGVLIVDDSIEAKPYTDESELICWHWDHVVNRSVKGVNLLTCLYYSQEVALPIAFELVTKPDFVAAQRQAKPSGRRSRTKTHCTARCLRPPLPMRFLLVMFSMIVGLRLPKT